MTARTVLVGLMRAAPGVAAAVGLGLFAARELGELLPDPIAMALAMFPAGYMAGRLRLARRSKPSPALPADK